MIPDPKFFEKAIGRLSQGNDQKVRYSCSAILTGNSSRTKGYKARKYAQSWFVNDFECSGSFPNKFTKSPSRRQYHRALWLTLLGLLAEEGQMPD